MDQEEAEYTPYLCEAPGSRPGVTKSNYCKEQLWIGPFIQTRNWKATKLFQ